MWRRTQLGALTIGFALIAAAGAPVAAAKPILVGPPLGTSFPKVIRATTSATFFNVSLSEPGALLTSPTDGAIVTARTAGAQGGPYRVRVLRPLGGNLYFGAGTSNPLYLEPPESSVLEPLRIHKGDAIGIDLEPGLTLAVTEPAGGSTANWVPPLAEGETRAYGPVRSSREFAFNVEVLPPPKVSSVRPRSIDFRHPRMVTIVGENLSSLRNVYFGAMKGRLPFIKSERRIVVLPLASNHPDGPASRSKLRPEPRTAPPQPSSPSWARGASSF